MKYAPLVDFEIESYLSDCRHLAVEQIRSFVPHESAFSPILYDLMLEYPLRAAKGLRPALCIAICRALGGNMEAVLPSASVIELYHNAFLIHDDVEDGSTHRRDLPTLHHAHGAPIAINVGDAMLALALKPLLDNMTTLGLGKSLRILQVISDMARESAEGQAIELDWIRRATWDLSDESYRDMVLKKTSWYSFIAPVEVGAIVAGAKREQLEHLRQFSTALGIAFQIRDDVLNLIGDESKYGKELLGDLWEGKRTLMLLHMLRTVSSDDRAEVLSILSKERPPALADGVEPVEALISQLVTDGHLSPQGARMLRAAVDTGHGKAGPRRKTTSDVAFLMACIQRSHSLDHAERLCRQYADTARAALRQVEPWFAPSVHVDFLHALIDFTVRRDY